MLGMPVSATAQVPAHLNIRSASVREASDFDPTQIRGRLVAIRLELAEAPTCAAGRDSLTYGILVDSDKTRGTGVRRSAFRDLGIDARVVARCGCQSSKTLYRLAACHLSTPGSVSFT